MNTFRYPDRFGALFISAAVCSCGVSPPNDDQMINILKEYLLKNRSGESYKISSLSGVKCEEKPNQRNNWIRCDFSVNASSADELVSADVKDWVLLSYDDKRSIVSKRPLTFEQTISFKKYIRDSDGISHVDILSVEIGDNIASRDGGVWRIDISYKDRDIKNDTARHGYADGQIYEKEGKIITNIKRVSLRGTKWRSYGNTISFDDDFRLYISADQEQSASPGYEWKQDSDYSISVNTRGTRVSRADGGREMSGTLYGSSYSSKEVPPGKLHECKFTMDSYVILNIVNCGIDSLNGRYERVIVR